MQTRRCLIARNSTSVNIPSRDESVTSGRSHMVYVIYNRSDCKNYQ